MSKRATLRQSKKLFVRLSKFSIISIVLNSNALIINNRLMKLVLSKQLIESFSLWRGSRKKFRALKLPTEKQICADRWFEKYNPNSKKVIYIFGMDDLILDPRLKVTGSYKLGTHNYI